MMMAYMTEEIDAAIDSALTKLGFENLKEKQREAVQAFVNGLPTGYGKSLL